MKYKYNGQWCELTIKALDGLPIGTIIQYAGGTTTPKGWMKCNGNAISRTEYPVLFAAIGTTYGAGDGSTTFNIPDFRGRVAVGVDTRDWTTPLDDVGYSGGQQKVTLSAAIGACNNDAATIGYVTEGATSYQNNHGAGYVIRGASEQTYNNWNHSVPVTESSSTQRDTSIMQPYLTVYYIIKVEVTSVTTGIVRNAQSSSNIDVYSCNYIDNKTGNLTNLTTTDKTSLVNAINELKSTIDNIVDGNGVYY